MRELAKTVALATWLRDSGVPVDLDWARNIASQRSQYVDRVPTLRNERQHQTERYVRTIHLTGGVNLGVKPVRAADTALAKAVDGVATPSLRTQPAFVVETGTARLQGHVLPVTRPGQGAWTRAGSHPFGDGVRTLDTAGRPIQLRHRNGPTVDYFYGKDGALVEARAVGATGPAESYRFGAGGQVVSGELRANIKLSVRRANDGRLESLRLSAPGGRRAEAFYGRSAGSGVPAGGSRITVVRGGRTLHYHYDAQGNLVSVNADGAHIASYKVEGGTTTARSGEYVETFTRGSDGRMLRYSRTAPDLDGRPLTETLERPTSPADRLEPLPDRLTPLPEGRLNLASGGTVEVGASTTRASTTLEVTWRPSRGEAFLARDARALEGARLGSPAAAERVIVMDAPFKVSELQSKFGETTEFFLGTEPQLALKNAKRLPLLKDANEVAIYFPGKSAGVTDFEAIQSIRDALPGMRVIESGTTDATSKVVMLTGHNSTEWRVWVESLGRAGAFRGKLVLLNSCHGALDTAWNARVIREFGATGTHAFAEEISPQAVKDVVVKLHDLLAAPRSVGESLPGILRKAVKQAVDDAPTQRLKKEIELMRKGITQISRIEIPFAMEAQDG
ncbi:MAG: hypothetical protein QM757_26085 [Paludibaculum sp.]